MFGRIKAFFKNRSFLMTTLIFWVSVYFICILNIPFLRAIFTQYQPLGNWHDYFVYTVPIFLFALCHLVFHLLALPVIHKIIIPILLIISAAISYNSLFFNVYFDRSMLTNVLETNTAESLRMMSFSYVLWLLLLGVLPALVYIFTKVRYQKWYRELGSRLLAVAVSLGVMGAIAAGFYQDYASFFRNHSNIKHLILPYNFVAASVSKIRRERQANIPYQALGADAKILKPDAYRHVTVIVVGETTRAQNWGLNGYAHQTTPKLANRLAKGDNLINFNNVSSCGTATALSVPCMFSSFTRETYDEALANRQDNLLDTLQTAGVQVHWVENNSDCKGVCKNVPTTDVIKLNLPEYCTDGECLDNIMLPEMDKVLSQSKKDTVLVLHTIGSHGPTYFERYTKDERLFTPTCDTKEINRCNNTELVNTYDNGIVYIDQFLDKVITRLEAHDDWESTMYYVSDHGESLGENGVYLHSTPYGIAPDYQTRVPMVMWFSPQWAKNEPFDLQCVRKIASHAYSHDNLFHTIFSMMDIDLKTIHQYDKNLDILAQCRK